MELLAHEGVELEGAHAVVVGRSKLVGVPVARLLLMANATVTMCHSRTRDLDAVCAQADILVAAVGVPRLLGAAAVKPGAVVIDVGINRLEEGLVGDVDFDAAAEVASAITPVPGGVGPMTIAMLLHNTLAGGPDEIGAPMTPDGRGEKSGGPARPRRRESAPAQRESARPAADRRGDLPGRRDPALHPDVLRLVRGRRRRPAPKRSAGSSPRRAAATPGRRSK